MARGKASGGRSAFGAGRGQAEEDSGDAWLTTYADAITLLMAFFVMLYAMSTTDVVKFEQFLKGLQDPFGNTTTTMGLLDSSVGIVGDSGARAEAPPPSSGAGPPDIVTQAMALPQLHAELATTEQEAGEDKADTAATEPFEADLDQLEEVRRLIVAGLESEGLTGVADYRRDERGLVISIASDDVLFASGSAVLNPVGTRIIGAVARPLRGVTNTVLVEGHTDNVPLQRAGYSNWNLSTDRSVAVVSKLGDKFGLDNERLGAVGYGEFRPRVPNDTPAHRSLNRRVDVVIVAKGA